MNNTASQSPLSIQSRATVEFKLAGESLASRSAASLGPAESANCTIASARSDTDVH